MYKYLIAFLLLVYCYVKQKGEKIDMYYRKGKDKKAEKKSLSNAVILNHGTTTPWSAMKYLRVTYNIALLGMQTLTQDKLKPEISNWNP